LIECKPSLMKRLKKKKRDQIDTTTKRKKKKNTHILFCPYEHTLDEVKLGKVGRRAVCRSKLAYYY
jgi:hypothetical protein